MRTTRAAKQPRRGEAPVSIRLEGALREEIRSLARRTGKPLSRLIKELLEMALRMQRFPGIVFIEGPAGRRAHLAGTGLDVWEVVELHGEYGSVTNLLEHFPRLSPRAVHTAEAYAKAYPEEIKAFLELNARAPEDLRREVPWLEAGRSQVLPGVILDADVPPVVATALRQRGYDVIAASGDPALGALGDLELLRVAAQQGRVLVTFNTVDFSELAKMFAHTQEDHAGIILVHSKTYRRTDIGGIARALDGLLRSRESVANSVLFLG